MAFRFFWIELEGDAGRLARSFGVTASSRDDALDQLRRVVFINRAMPSVVTVVEDVDIESLDMAHVRQNMGVPVGRGIWYPMGYRP